MFDSGAVPHFAMKDRHHHALLEVDAGEGQGVVIEVVLRLDGFAGMALPELYPRTLVANEMILTTGDFAVFVQKNAYGIQGTLYEVPRTCTWIGI